MPFETIIALAAHAAKISAPLLLAVCAQESGLQNKITPKDGKTASYGICQVKLATARGVGYVGGPKGLMDPAKNAKFAALYLKFQLERYDNDWCKATAAYNAGSYKESKKFPGYPKNLKYVKKVQIRIESALRPLLSCDRYRYDRYVTGLRIQSAEPKNHPNWCSGVQSAKRGADRAVLHDGKSGRTHKP